MHHIIRRGDTLHKITKRLGKPIHHLILLNPHVYNPNRIYLGQKVRVH
ncbi:LysM peptidoglycan-binding domain-containing protein [Desulfosporosinus sp. Sb-LF]|nr:LysM peptidoglycan-binding domain-containing protein [Desulfosporosinus sp. Sb-LF]TGE33571.1 LysM peptidoglycan-binding domain-containing protein [Desulfosporosinus sp. Sb-LF]